MQLFLGVMKEYVRCVPDKNFRPRVPWYSFPVFLCPTPAGTIPCRVAKSFMPS